MDEDQRNRLALLIECCLEHEKAYEMFNMLADISRLDIGSRMKYIDLVRISGCYTEEEIAAIERLVMSGTAAFFMDMINKVRDERIQQEIEGLIS